MRHRHIVNSVSAARSPMAIDDIIARGNWRDWTDLRRWCAEDPALLEDVKRVCSMHVGDPGAQRHHFWLTYARQAEKRVHAAT